MRKELRPDRKRPRLLLLCRWQRAVDIAKYAAHSPAVVTLRLVGTSCAYLLSLEGKLVCSAVPPLPTKPKAALWGPRLGARRCCAVQTGPIPARPWPAGEGWSRPRSRYRSCALPIKKRRCGALRQRKKAQLDPKGGAVSGSISQLGGKVQHFLSE